MNGVRRVLNELQLVVDGAKAAGRGEAGYLAIGFYTSLSAGNLRASLVEFGRRFPQVEISTVEGSRTRLFDRIQNGTVDIAVSISQSSRESRFQIGTGRWSFAAGQDFDPIDQSRGNVANIHCQEVRVVGRTNTPATIDQCQRTTHPELAQIELIQTYVAEAEAGVRIEVSIADLRQIVQQINNVGDTARPRSRLHRRRSSVREHQVPGGQCVSP